MTTTMPPTILIIDDSEDDQHLYRRALKDCDCSLEMFTTAETSLARVDDVSSNCKRPDLILLDYNLPDMDGLDFMKKLAKSRTATIPIIMLTCEGSVEIAVEVMKQGAFDYLAKDTTGQYLKLLPGVIERSLSFHRERELSKRLQNETEILLRRNRALMLAATDGIHVMDMQGNLIEANDAFCQMLGYTQTEIAGLNVADWNAQWSMEELREKFRSLSGKSTRFETVHRRKDGTLLNVEVSSTSVEIEGGNLFFASSRDITERKRAEEELKLSALLLNSTSDSVFLLDLDGRFVFFNKAAWQSRGYTRDELMAMNVRELNAPESSKLFTPRIKAVLENGHGIFEAEHRCKDGSIMFVEVNARVIETDGQKRVLSVSRDITERKKTEAVLKQYKLVIDTAIDGFWETDLMGNVLEVNEAYAKMSGYTTDELVNMHISQLEAIEQKPEDVHAHIAKVMAQGYDRFETRHRHKDGREIDIGISVTYMAEPQRLIVFCRDISARKRRDKEINQARIELQDLYDQAPCGYHSLDSEGRIVRINQREADWLGYERAELLGRKIQEFETTSSLAAFAKNYPAFKEKGYIENVEYEFVRKDGSTFPVLLSATMVKDTDGNFVMSRSTMIDVTERKQAEVALQRSEANLRAILDNSPYLAWLKDSEGRYIMINKVFADYLRLEDVRLATGKTDLDLQPKALAEKYRADDAEVMATRQRKHVEESSYNGNHIHWLETFKTPIIDNQGNVLGTVGFASDITARKQADEAKLQERDVRFRGTMEQVGVGIIHVSLDGDFKQINQKFCEIVGYARDELIHKSFQDIIFPDDLDQSIHYIRELLANEIPAFSMEKRYVRKDRNLVWVNLTVSLLRNIDGIPTYLIGVIEDISERKQAEKLLRASSEEIEDLYNHAPCGYHSLDRDGIIRIINDTELGWLGYSRDEIIGKCFADVLTPDSLQTFRQNFPHLKETGEIHDVELNLVCKDGTVFPVMISATALSDEDGNFIMSRSTIYDMSERKKMEQERTDYLLRLETASRHLVAAQEDARRRLSSELHDRTSPNLAAININLNVIASELPKTLSDDLAERMDDTRALISDTTASIREICADMRPPLLDYAGLAAALESYVHQFARRTGIEVRFDCLNHTARYTPELESLLFRIAQESLTNCAKHAQATSVKLTLSDGTAPIVLTIMDDGIGFDPRLLGKNGLTGLGVLNMREMAEVAGGRFNLESAPGKGTYIVVEISL